MAITYINLTDTSVLDPNAPHAALDNLVADGTGLGDPAGSDAVTVELLTGGGAALLSGAPVSSSDVLFSWVPNGGDGSSGSGIFPSVLRIGANTNTTQGFNDDTPKTTLNDVNSAVHTHSLLLADLLPVTIGAEQYYEFRLDLNQPGSSPDIVLDEFKVYTSGAAAVPTDFNAGPDTLGGGPSGTIFDLAYDMGPNAVLLNAHNSGSGHSDYIIDIPVADFIASDSYVTLYAKFGGLPGFNNAGGYEEFDAVTNGGTVPVGTQGISVAKVANTTDVCDTGETIGYTEYITNTGDTPLYDITVTDVLTGTPTPVLGADNVHNIGDTNNNGVFDGGETWLYSSSYVTQTSDFANPPNPAPIVNTVEFTVSDSPGGPVLFDQTAEADVAVDIDSLKLTKDTLQSQYISKVYDLGATLSADISVANGNLLAGTGLTWVYDLNNNGNVDISAPTVSDLGSDLSIPNVQMVLGDGALGHGDSTHNIGDANDDGVINVGETWEYYATGTAITGTYSNTATGSGAFLDGLGNTCTPTDQASSGYTGWVPSIAIDKQISLDGVHWLDVGNGNLADNTAVAPGTTLEVRVIITNTSDPGSGLNETVSVTDAADTAALDGITFSFPGNLTTVTLTPGASLTSNPFSFTALEGPHLDTATVSGNATDAFNDSAPVTASDSANYTGFAEGTPGLTIGYWYNHWTPPTHGNSSGPNVTQFEVYAPNDPGHTGGKGILLGDVNGNLVKDAGEVTLWIPDAAAHQLINSSQSANDTRQTLLSQAIATQLNIDNGDKDPGYNGVTGLTQNLITEAVNWLEGNPVAGGSIDPNHDGILTAGTTNAFEYNTKTAAFTSPVLTSSSAAWQMQEAIYQAADWHPTGPGSNGAGPGLPTPYSADGEGLKNALQAFNQNQLVTSADGKYVAWDPSGSTSGPFFDIILNGPNDFWSILHLQTLHGIL